MTQLQGFLGAVGWFRHFNNNMADIAQPFNNVLKGLLRYVWTTLANDAFKKLNEILAEDIILNHPDVYKSSEKTQFPGTVSNGHERRIYFACKAFDPAQIHYSTFEKEAFAIIYSLNNFAEYLDGAIFPIETDNQAITYLSKHEKCQSQAHAMGHEDSGMESFYNPYQRQR